MRDEKMANGLSCTWLTVTDDAGRTHLEARWTPVTAVSAHAA